MAQEKIPFGNNQASGLDALAGAPPIAMNIVTEPGTGAIRRRPGIVSYISATVNADGIDGLYETVTGDLFAVGGVLPNRNIYLVTPTGAASLSGYSGANLLGTSRPVFAETEAILAIAGGDAPQKVILPAADPQGSQPYESSRLGGSPPVGSHIVANASRLLGNNTDSDKDQINYSAVATGSAYTGFEDWTTVNQAGEFQANARPDPVVALAENTNEVFVFGSTSLQVWAPDATAAYAPVVTTETGCSAPYSVIKVDSSFAVLDHLRRFVMTDGRTTEVISEGIQRTLNDMETVSDCYGFRVMTGPLDLLVWSFPTDGRTFVYQKGVGWSQWSGWDSTSSTWGTFDVTAKTLHRSTSDVLVGTSTGKVGRMTFDASADFGGPNINAFIETGFISHGTENRKHCNSVTFSLRRGETTGTSEPYALLSWRDNTGPWEPGIPVSLGSTGDYYDTVQLYSLGVYRRRQWRLEFNGDETLVVASVVEDFDILDIGAAA